jgi:energy-converting hydrogenase Eha subunit C
MIAAILAVICIMVIAMSGRVFATIVVVILLVGWIFVHIIKEVRIENGKIKITYYKEW